MAKYIATNINSGEIIESDAQFIADQLGVSRDRIYKASSCGSKINKQWTIEVLYDEWCSIIPKSLKDEWIKTTQEVRELLEKYPRNVVPVKRKSHFRNPF